ncbi:uncharacterized protein LOC125812819 [Solanum verrucosum]|uniref:uncharacterized protein LOC125812819 n=1 Tax=Solanum verrucosum TaxID=315347 RepID=UPI0020D1232E|nr:uncharacterized protein LOC125812819 [Solanum verrucosum]
MRVLKKLNLDWGAASNQRMSGLNELDEFHLKAYESAALYKEKMKKYHDQMIEKQEFVVGDLVLLFNSRLSLFPGKLKSKWTGPFLVTQVLPHGAVDLENSEGTRFKHNVVGQNIGWALKHQLLESQPSLMNWVTLQPVKALNAVLKIHHLRRKEKLHLKCGDQLIPRSG